MGRGIKLLILGSWDSESAGLSQIFAEDDGLHVLTDLEPSSIQIGLRRMVYHQP